MNHTEWLRLQTEGEKICSSLRQQNYRCLKQTRRLSWKISKEGTSYQLTWLPAPVNDWNLIPNDTTETREKLMQAVQSTLNTIRGTQANTINAEDYSRPWAIVRILPDLRHYTVARFYNRADAQDHLRFLKRSIPAAEFELIFDIPTDLTE